MPEICAEEIAEEILFVFCFDVWPGFTSNKPTYYILDYGDFYYLSPNVNKKKEILILDRTFLDKDCCNSKTSFRIGLISFREY